jgi:hypothetical protein
VESYYFSEISEKVYVEDSCLISVYGKSRRLYKPTEIHKQLGVNKNSYSEAVNGESLFSLCLYKEAVASTNTHHILYSVGHCDLREGGSKSLTNFIVELNKRINKCYIKEAATGDVISLSEISDS